MSCSRGTRRIRPAARAGRRDAWQPASCPQMFNYYCTSRNEPEKKSAISKCVRRGGVFTARECITLPFPPMPFPALRCRSLWTGQAQHWRGVARRGEFNAACRLMQPGLVHSFISWNAKCASLSVQSNGMQLGLPRPRPDPPPLRVDRGYLLFT